MIALKLIASFFGIVAFSVLFSIPFRYSFLSGFAGMCGYAVYTLITIKYNRPIVATLVASFLLTILSRYMSVKFKAPTILFLLCGIFTLVPGNWIYYTAYYALESETMNTIKKGMESIKIAMAIGLGIGIAYSLPPKLFGWKNDIDILGNRRY